MAPHLLYVEDDESLSFVTRDNLELQGYRMTCCADGKQALAAIRSDRFDLCILDVMLPEIDGFTLARHIREADPHVPILFLTAKSLKEDRLKGLRLGADDYITKPFSIEELILKVEVFLKRNKITALRSNQQVWQLGKYRFHYRNLSLTLDQQERKLTVKEADLLRLLAENANQLLKRSTILEQVWGQDDYFLGRSLDVFISRLRKYLREDPSLRIETVHGVGFRLLTS